MLKAQTPSLWLVVFAMVGVVACGGDDAESGDDSGTPADDASDGGSNADTDAGDDTQLPDGGEPDGGTPDAEVPDTEVPDSGAPDAEVPDSDPGVDGTVDTEDIDESDSVDPDAADGEADAGGEDTTPDADPIDSGTDTTAEVCTTPNVGDLVINEILPSPATGAAGDANCDGTRNAVDDEFVELMNASGGCLDLSGVYLLVESAGPQFTFPEGTELPADGVAVVFGGGIPTFDGSSTQTTSQCVDLSGCDVQFFTAAPGALALAPEDSFSVGLGETLLNSVTWGAGGIALVAGQSLTRVPERTGAFVAHGTTSSMFVMSPGTRSDGASFGVCTE